MKRHRPPEPLLCKIPRRFPLLILISALISQSVSLASANVRAVASRRSSREQKQSRNGFPEDLENKITEIVRNSGAETVSVVYYDLANARELLINPDISFHAASTMKVPVMMEIFRQAAAGKLSLDQRISIKNDFASIVDGSPYSLSPDSDSEQILYTRVGQTESIRELMRLMIIVSSNLATNLLMELVTPDRVMDLMRVVGAKNIHVLRGVEDGKAFQNGLNNTTTARDLMIIFRRIAERRAVSPKASDEMIKIMLDQTFNEGIPAGLPPEARVSHKTGSITKVNHDAAIVYPPDRKPYVLVVLTRGLEDEKAAHKLIADISRVVYASIQ
ncbi:MAG TPA: serine hydrolase [Blastocatellia bacterium]|nr:serine hydrolase [Blastocatellia bacterium]